jgi:hypothetical protein
MYSTMLMQSRFMPSEAAPLARSVLQIHTVMTITQLCILLSDACRRGMRTTGAAIEKQFYPDGSATAREEATQGALVDSKEAWRISGQLELCHAHP